MGSHLGPTAMATRCSSAVRDLVGDGVPVKLRRREDDDDVRDDEAKTKTWSTWSGSARIDYKE